ncbi:unnamed protein product, partial [Pylaiella littoralis]
AAFACCASSQRYVASLSASVSLHLSQIDGLSGVDMATNNLTMRPEDYSPSGVNLRWPTCSDDTKHHFHLTEVEAALIVLLACVLASNWQLRRKNSNNSRPRGQSKRDVLAESTVQRSRWHFDWVSVVDLSLRLYSLLLCALLPFDRHVDQDGQLKQHTRRAVLPPEPATAVLALDESQQIKRRRACKGGAQSDGLLASTGAPRHVAIIMDGNRRFGRVKYSDPLKGHSDGGKRLGEFLEWCMEAGVAMATAFAFSTENWKRDAHEVELLMDLVCSSCGELMEDAVKKNMRIRVLSSDPTKLPERVLTAIRKAEDETRDCTGFLLNICLSYGARQEIANACRQIAGDVASGVTCLDAVDEFAVEKHLLTRGLPDPDIVIRTSGEKRVSNFLLFQMAYTELFFVDKLWPDITRSDVLDIFEAYRTRERR